MDTEVFTAHHPLRQLIRTNPALLMLLRRFGISLGFGNETVATVCEKSGISTDTFLALANFISGNPWRQNTVVLTDLMVYLKNAHDYFLGFALPTIRRKLIEALPISDPNSIAMLIIRYFDDYVAEVRAHMGFENEYVFPYIESLLSGSSASRSFNIADFEASHKPLAPKLQELKELFICHFHAADGNDDLLTSALYDIITCENDIQSHCAIEDSILIPTVEALPANTGEDKGNGNQLQESQELTNREREIVCCIAKGLSTKEIADKLFLSVHTVNTHRRNISSKLDIHSASALTIYAIIHNLLDVSEISPNRKD